MTYLLNLCYLLLLAVASPWLAYAALTKGKYRQGLAAKFLGAVPRRTTPGPCVWLHAVSVGEVNLLEGILQDMESRFPRIECVLSTTTMTGFALAQKKYAGRLVFYCPLDFSWAVKRSLRRIRPDVLVLAELELWPNLVRLAHRHGVKVAVINGRLSATSFAGYRRIRPLVRSVLQSLDVIAAQNAEYAERFQALGALPETVQVTGSLKFDGAQRDRRNSATQRLARLAGIDDADIVFLAGSTQPPEEELALDVYRQLCAVHPRLRLILVPRHPHRFESVASLLDRCGARWQRRSHLDEQGAVTAARVLLVDTVGELGDWWGTARIAFVGGSMGTRGGQNMIEPAAYGAAVCFGPNTRNFRDVVAAMLAAKAARVVDDRQALCAFVQRCLEEPGYADTLGQRARELVAAQAGATRRTLNLLQPLVPPAAEPEGSVATVARPWGTLR